MGLFFCCFFFLPFPDSILPYNFCQRNQPREQRFATSVTHFVLTFTKKSRFYQKYTFSIINIRDIMWVCTACSNGPFEKHNKPHNNSHTVFSPLIIILVLFHKFNSFVFILKVGFNRWHYAIFFFFLVKKPGRL